MTGPSGPRAGDQGVKGEAGALAEEGDGKVRWAVKDFGNQPAVVL